MTATPPRRGSGPRSVWAITVALSLGMLLVPIGFGVLLSADGGQASSADEPAAAATGRSKSDRAARVTFHLRDGSLGMRILRGAPRETKLVRGRRVRVVCGSVSGLMIREARWPAASDTLRVALPGQAVEAVEFCALKRGRLGIARAVLR